MSLVCAVLLKASVAFLGVFAGAMLTEAVVLVPYWRSLAPAEFFAWYAANDRRLLGYFGPLTAVTAIVVVAAAMVALATRHPGGANAISAVLMMVPVVASFPLYFKRANERFAAASIAPDEVAAELARWSKWHQARTSAALVALIQAMGAL